MKNNRKHFKLGTRAFAASAIAIAVVIVVNLLLAQLPTSVGKPDISGTNLYDISQVTLDVLDGLDKDVEVILIVEEGNLDGRVRKFLEKYTSLSDRLIYQHIDPQEDPTATQTYEASANTIVIRCPDTGKQTVVACAGFQGYSDAIVSYDADVYMQYQQMQEVAFDGEGQMTAAVNFVTNEVSKTIYTLTGHSEAELGATLSGMITKASLTLVEEPLDLLMTGSVPADCDLLIVNAPSTDLTADELELLQDYMANGGKILMTIDTNKLTNFSALTQTYGMALQEGLLGDYSRVYSMYASEYGYFCIAPMLSQSHEITADLTAGVISFYPNAMLRTDPARDTISLVSFMNTSDQGFLYVGQEEDPETGTYLMGAVATEETAGGTARLTVLTNSIMYNEDIAAFYSASKDNLNLFMNAVTANFAGEVANTSIAPISLSVENVMVPNANLWGILLVGILPVGILVVGLVYWLKRRKR